MALSKVSGTETEDLFAKGQRLARELIELLQDAIGKRRNLAQSLELIAEDLDDVKEKVNVANVVGSLVGIVGAVGAVGAVVVTGGLAAPAVVAVGSAIGAGITAAADLIGKKVSKKTLHKAQAILDEDKEITEKIDKKLDEVKQIATTLSKSFNIPEEQVFGLLMLGGHEFSPSNKVYFHFDILMLGTISVESAIMTLIHGAGKDITIAVEEISLEVLTRAFGIALGVVVAVWDAVNLIKTIVDLAKGSHTEAAKTLRDTAGKIEDSVRKVEQILEEQRECAEKFKTRMKKRFTDLMEKVSTTQCPTEDELHEINFYIFRFANEEWRKCIENTNILKDVVVSIAQLFSYLYSLIKSHQKKKKCGTSLRVIFIGHGSVDSFTIWPAQFYYLSPKLKNIRLYSPWGCSVDSAVVYGIGTNRIQPGNRKFTNNQAGPFTPRYETCKNYFNDLPQSPKMIPTPSFFPVRQNDTVYQDLWSIYNQLQQQTNDLVVPYTGDMIPLPKVPLWLVTNALALIGTLRNLNIDFCYAACLSWDSNTPPSLNWTNPQYCYVRRKQPPESMTCTLLNNGQPSRQFVASYNRFETYCNQNL